MAFHNHSVDNVMIDASHTPHEQLKAPTGSLLPQPVVINEATTSNEVTASLVANKDLNIEQFHENRQNSKKEESNYVVKTARKFPEPITTSTPNAQHSPAVLVVGGTDGSGTRRVVQTLAEIGVVMVSEDPETYDIHADLVKGWPEVVNPVISATRSLNYDPKKLINALQDRSRKNIGAILNQVDKDSVKPQSFKLAVGGVLPHPSDATTEGVKYGFKAPVAMTLAPWFAELSPHFKLVHVLRDGRDISFSANQGPVTKFFNTMYGAQNAQLPGPVKGIKLWSDWNSQIYKWAQEYMKKVDQESLQSSERSFGYFALHSEDLVHPSVSVRYAAIKHLASFVGSTMSSDRLCCIALKESGFMGSHDRTPINKQVKKDTSSVSKRYGKWHAILEKNPSLSATIHAQGAEGLRIFGYEPQRVLADDSMRGGEYEDEYCSREVHGPSCAALEPKPEPIDFKAYAVSGLCTTQDSIDFIGGDLEAIPLSSQDKTACCRRCKDYEGCAYFVYDTVGEMCYLKSLSQQGTKPKDNLIAGTML